MSALNTTDNCHLIDINPDTKHPDIAWEKMKDQIEKIDDVQALPLNIPILDNKIRFVCMSDTHCQTSMITSVVNIPDGDIFIHAGDFTTRGRIEEIEGFNTFLESLNKKFKFKVVIAGNHELLFDESNTELKRQKYEVKNDSNINVRELLTNCHYLENNGITLFGLNIYGSPFTASPGWAFNAARGEESLKIWNKIPNNTDVLITHGPPIGFGDRVIRKDGTTSRVGCCELLSTIQKRVKPKYHVYGHIHEDYGIRSDKQTIYINASNFNRGKVQPPVIFDIDLPKGYSK